MGLDVDGLEHLLRWVQDGTVSRRQLLGLGAEPHDVSRLRRRRELRPVHRGVYVDHTGELTWRQRAWCAVHVYWPAALSHESALPRPHPTAPIHVAVEVARTVVPTRGIVVHRMVDLEHRADWRKAPPRVRLEQAVVDVMSRSEAAAAHQALADACRTREVSPAQVREALESRRRVPQRRLILGLVDDLERGACSVLEREYLHGVERRHGLPTGERQAPLARRPGLRDVLYRDFQVAVELDGRAFHDGVDDWNDAYDRDLEAAVDGERTVRLSYRQVFRDGCRTADRIGTILQRQGWTASVMRCPSCRVER